MYCCPYGEIKMCIKIGKISSLLPKSHGKIRFSFYLDMAVYLLYHIQITHPDRLTSFWWECSKAPSDKCRPCLVGGAFEPDVETGQEKTADQWRPVSSRLTGGFSSGFHGVSFATKQQLIFLLRNLHHISNFYVLMLLFQGEEGHTAHNNNTTPAASNGVLPHHKKIAKLSLINDISSNIQRNSKTLNAPTISLHAFPRQRRASTAIQPVKNPLHGNPCEKPVAAIWMDQPLETWPKLD